MMDRDVDEIRWRMWIGAFGAWAAAVADQAWPTAEDKEVWQLGPAWRIAQEKLRELVAEGRANDWLGEPVEDLSAWYDVVDGVDAGEEAGDGSSDDDAPAGGEGVAAP